MATSEERELQKKGFDLRGGGELAEAVVALIAGAVVFGRRGWTDGGREE